MVSISGRYRPRTVAEAGLSDGVLESFQRSVRGRLERAWVVVVEAGGRSVFVGYADVQRSEGWLLQGICISLKARRRTRGSSRALPRRLRHGPRDLEARRRGVRGSAVAD